MNDIYEQIQSGDLLIIQGYRLWDLYAYSIAKSLSIPVFYIQHGVFSSSIKRAGFSNLLQPNSSLSRFLTLLIVVSSISIFSIPQKLSWILFYLFNVSVRRTSKTCLDVQHAFYYGSSWKKWHYDNVGLNPSECSFFTIPILIPKSSLMNISRFVS